MHVLVPLLASWGLWQDTVDLALCQRKSPLFNKVPGAWGKVLSLWASSCSSVRWAKEYPPHSVLGTRE